MIQHQTLKKTVYTVEHQIVDIWIRDTQPGKSIQIYPNSAKLQTCELLVSRTSGKWHKHMYETPDNRTFPLSPVWLSVTTLFYLTISYLIIDS